MSATVACHSFPLVYHRPLIELPRSLALDTIRSDCNEAGRVGMFGLSSCGSLTSHGVEAR